MPASTILVGNRLCLDFINTEILDGVTDYATLVSWARAAGALDNGEADFVADRWAGGDEAETAWLAARSLRAQIRSMADALMRGAAVPPAAIQSINEALRNRPGYLQLEAMGPDWAARWKVPLRRPDDVLWRIARSAASLLSEDDPALVKRCERTSCGLYFYDTTKNHRKRWCRMDVCGAAVRAAAYYQRQKE